LRLHWNALPAQQQKVLRACAGPARCWSAYLAGGTALALQLGHRRTEDLDWFTPETLDPGELLADVEAMGRPLTVVQNEVGTFLATVDGVKFSVFRYRYSTIAPFVEANGVNLASIRDLAAMKLLALMGRATKRDYVDVHELLVKKHMTLPAIVQAFEAKYPSCDTSGALRALTFFDDVIGDMPIMLTATTWKEVTSDLTRIAKR
jgi:predicted nucleotidyltransferase component of viral defense system